VEYWLRIGKDRSLLGRHCLLVRAVWGFLRRRMGVEELPVRR
jgi:hypothetical protein